MTKQTQIPKKLEYFSYDGYPVKPIEQGGFLLPFSMAGLVRIPPILFSYSRISVAGEDNSEHNQLEFPVSMRKISVVLERILTSRFSEQFREEGGFEYRFRPGEYSDEVRKMFEEFNLTTIPNKDSPQRIGLNHAVDLVSKSKYLDGKIIQGELLLPNSLCVRLPSCSYTYRSGMLDGAYLGEITVDDHFGLDDGDFCNPKQMKLYHNGDLNISAEDFVEMGMPRSLYVEHVKRKR